MKFLYKINSGYDGFTPQQIPQRVSESDGRLELGWALYLDSVSLHDECWIYFRGPHKFDNGVYIKGTISSIDRAGRRVLLTIKEESTDEPLTDRVTTARVEDVVSVRFRQVFTWPDDWAEKPECSSEACRRRLCSDCEDWQQIARIESEHVWVPSSFPVDADRFIPAYWIIPSRCYLWSESKEPAQSIRRITYMFNDFKVGEARYAYPFALAMFQALNDRTDLDFDAVVPIPLSPDKIDAQELHRTKCLARELGRLIEIPVRELLTLAEPISKRTMLSEGNTKAQFEARYYELLKVDHRTQSQNRILLIDDVCTRGSTLKQASKKLLSVNPDLELVLATAGQMIVKAAVADESGLLA